MRTASFPSVAQVIDRVRGQTRRLVARVPAHSVRWVVALGAILVVGSIAYVVTGTPTAASAYIRGGTKFSDDDILAITGVLNAKHLPFRIVDDGRIEVSSDRLDDANDAIAKLEVGPRRLDDIEKKRAESWSLLETTEEKIDRLEKANAEQLAGYIQRLPGIVSSRVKVIRGKGRDARRVGTAGPSAFVYLETQARREIPHRVVKSIQDLVVGNNPDVRPTAITIMDQTGHSYLDAKNPSLGVLSRQRAREEEYRDEIAKKLDWVSGAEVSVQLLAVVETANPPIPKPEPPPAAPAEEIRLPALPKMSLNQPIEVEPDPVPAPTPPLAAVPAPAPTPAIVSENASEEDESAHTRARVLVTVPRSFYLGRINSREPSIDDLQAIESRTEKAIKLAVAIVIPPERLAEVNVTRILDELPPTTPPPSANVDTRRSFSWWALAAVAVTEVFTAIGLAYGLLAGRRPVSRLRERDRSRDDRGRYKIDEAGTDSPGPSERVRELIRQNPEAAASVLHRWTGQGGPIG